MTVGRCMQQSRLARQVHAIMEFPLHSAGINKKIHKWKVDILYCDSTCTVRVCCPKLGLPTIPGTWNLCTGMEPSGFEELITRVEKTQQVQHSYSRLLIIRLSMHINGFHTSRELVTASSHVCKAVWRGIRGNCAVSRLNAVGGSSAHCNKAELSCNNSKAPSLEETSLTAHISRHNMENTMWLASLHRPTL